MSAASSPPANARRLPSVPNLGPNASKIAGGIALVVAILFPFFYDPLSGFLDATTTALAYVVMALGLNIVVGFAGPITL